MNTRLLVVVQAMGWLLLGGVGSLSAQDAASQEVPMYLRLTRGAAKPGTLSEISKVDSARSTALTNAGWRRPSIAFTSVSGTEEVLFLSFFESLAGLEKDREDVAKNPVLKNELDRIARQEGDLLLSKRDVVAMHRKDVTYMPKFDWAQTRCLDMITIHLNAGRHAEYLENRKISLEAHQRGGLETHLYVYSVVSGMPSWTYLVVRPVTSLKTLDFLRSQDYGEPMSAEQEKRKRETFAIAVQSEEEQYFCVDSGMSYAPPAWAGSNLGFWKAPSTPGVKKEH